MVHGREVPFRNPQVLATDDANQQFNVVLTTSEDLQQEQPLLMLGAVSVPATSWGNSSDEFEAVAMVGTPEAQAFARAMGVLARERAMWPGRLGGSLEPMGSVAAGAAKVPMRFCLANTGPVAFWFMDGGRGRNELGRDNRFTIEVERDREKLPIRMVPDFGGMGVYRRLEPEGRWTLDLDLRHWCALDRAGTYTVRATYEAELMPADYKPGETLQPGWHSYLTRTRAVTASCVLVVP